MLLSFGMSAWTDFRSVTLSVATYIARFGVRVGPKHQKILGARRLIFAVHRPTPSCPALDPIGCNQASVAPKAPMARRRVDFRVNPSLDSEPPL